MSCFPGQAANRDSSTECQSQGESKRGSCLGRAAHQAEGGAVTGKDVPGRRDSREAWQLGAWWRGRGTRPSSLEDPD